MIKPVKLAGGGVPLFATTSYKLGKVATFTITKPNNTRILFINSRFFFFLFAILSIGK